jgi:hypothetical protein
MDVPESTLRDFLFKNPDLKQNEAGLPKLGRPFTFTADVDVKLYNCAESSGKN